MTDPRREELISVGTSLVQQAFAMPPETSVCMMDGFNGARRVVGSLALKRCKPNLIHSASETHRAQYSKPVLPDRHRIQGKVRRAIAELPELQQLWIHAHYRAWENATRKEAAERFIRLYTQQYLETHMPKSRTKLRWVITDLVARATANLGIPVQPRQDYDIQPRNWNATYAPHLRRIRGELVALDEGALVAVARKMGWH